jgi:hypothetical protein
MYYMLLEAAVLTNVPISRVIPLQVAACGDTHPVSAPNSAFVCPADSEYNRLAANVTQPDAVKCCKVRPTLRSTPGLLLTPLRTRVCNHCVNIRALCMCYTLSLHAYNVVLMLLCLPVPHSQIPTQLHCYMAHPDILQ